MSSYRHRPARARRSLYYFAAASALIAVLPLHTGQAQDASRAVQRMQDMSLAVEALARRVRPAVVEIMVTGTK